MLIKTKALVLHTFKYSDEASVAVLFTEAEGAVSFRIRLPKTSRSNVKQKLFQPLTILDIEWEPHHGVSLQRMRNCQCPHPYSTLPFHPLKSCITLFLAEVLLNCLKNEHTPQPHLFNYLTSSLRWLDLADSSFSNYHIVFLLKLSHFLGFMPRTEDYKPHQFFDLQNSRFTDTLPDHLYYIKEEEAALLPVLASLDYATMNQLKLSRTQRNRYLDILNDYYQLHVPEFPRMKSLEVLREVLA